MYKIKEIYYTLQGEGHHSGRAAVFLRFSGCNLWSGIEKDRHKAVCKFCDTDFWGTDGINGGKYTARQLAEKCKSLWPTDLQTHPFIVCTGGEPLLQLDGALIDALHYEGFYIAIESNGTIEVPEGIDWICISPKLDADLIVTQGQELKLVYPQVGPDPSTFLQLDFDHFYLQPLDDVHQLNNIEKCIERCKQNPMWKLSIQMHKTVGIP